MGGLRAVSGTRSGCCGPMTAAIERPWERVRQPPELPASPTAAALRTMTEQEFAELLRAHLVPRGTDKQDRERWDRFWQVLNTDDALNDRAFGILEVFQSVTESAAPATDREAQRMTRFLRQVTEAQNRLEWELPSFGPAVAAKLRTFPGGTRRHLIDLISAIDAHRADTLAAGSPTPADQELWSVLADVGLDPREDTRP